jgi:hypothetical protein
MVSLQGVNIAHNVTLVPTSSLSFHISRSTSLFSFLISHQELCNNYSCVTMFSASQLDREKHAEDAESLLSHSNLEEGEEQKSIKTRRCGSIQHTLLLILTHFFVAGTAVWLWSYGKPDFDSVCAMHTSNYCKLPNNQLSSSDL